MKRKTGWRRFAAGAALAAVCLLGTGPEARAGEKKAELSFKDYYAKVAAYYPKLKKQEANVELALARKFLAAAGYWPRLQGSVSAVRGNDPVYVFGSLLRENAFTERDFALDRLNTPGAHTALSAGLSVQLPVFDAFQTILRVRAARLHVDAARYEAGFTKMEALLLAAQAYLRAQAAVLTAREAEAVCRAGEEDVRQAEGLKDKGLILGADFFAAKVMQGNIVQLKNRLARESAAALSLLNILAGVDPETPVELPSRVGTRAAGKGAGTLASWIEEAYRSRPDLGAVQKALEARRLEVRREKAAALPQVEAFARTDAQTESLSEEGGDSYMIGVSARMDLFDPGRGPRTRTAEQELKILEQDRAALRDAIAGDLAGELARGLALAENLPVAEKALDDARQAVEMMLPLYREGRKSIADLLEIRYAYLGAASAFHASAAEAGISRARLLFLAGHLDGPGTEEITTTIDGR